MPVTEAQFVAVFDKYMFDVREEAILLFRAGVVHTQCVKIAMEIAEAKAVTRALSAQQFGVGRG